MKGCVVGRVAFKGEKQDLQFVFFKALTAQLLLMGEHKCFMEGSSNSYLEAKAKALIPNIKLYLILVKPYSKK